MKKIKTKFVYLKFFLLIFVLASTSILPQNELTKVRSLKVDSLISELTVYFTPGYKQRAEYLAGILTEANHFFRDSLGVEYDYSLAVLDETQWNELNSPYPCYVKHQGQLKIDILSIIFYLLFKH